MQITILFADGGCTSSTLVYIVNKVHYLTLFRTLLEISIKETFLLRLLVSLKYLLGTSCYDLYNETS